MIDPSRRLAPSTAPEDHPIHHAAEAGELARVRALVFAHIPLWSVYPEWRWGTDDSEQVLSYLKRFGSVSVLNGHIAWRLAEATAAPRRPRLKAWPLLPTARSPSTIVGENGALSFSPNTAAIPAAQQVSWHNADSTTHHSRRLFAA